MFFIHLLNDISLQLLHIAEFPEMFCMLRGFLFVIEPAPLEVCRTKEEKQDKYISAHKHENQDRRDAGVTRESVGMEVRRTFYP